MPVARHKRARSIEEGDLIIIGGIKYEVTTTTPRYVGDIDQYQQIFARVEGAMTTDNTDITLLIPMDAVLKVTSRNKPTV